LKMCSPSGDLLLNRHAFHGGAEENYSGATGEGVTGL
jgi:hypothetical protein